MRRRLDGLRWKFGAAAAIGKPFGAVPAEKFKKKKIKDSPTFYYD